MKHTVEQRIKRLEDLEEIRTLQAIYGHTVDKGWAGKEIDMEKLAEIFTENATWECPDYKISAKGLQEIVETFKAMDAEHKFFLHSFTNPIIDIEGDKAKAKWILFSPIMPENRVNCLLASYDNDYVRTSKGWRLQALRLHIANFLGE
ncbi:nuclear transport factor 2 family protein [Ancylomarina sp. 16SWW S1-10-2]|uniref:nuclear transport factor 2 family protein n=1 Tax=Ancylomarina sp. 16SWW S1-10-2 TaxID=2499681 RepID=UPI0012AEA8A2|nr:nuclear transport factor 2 family protein [Ancylomarina sp. 16SWW S1-10-2]MRT92891.1 nuclear transport factor 2 family protein [Ancylomarina sp. 16SWW S1-10-2]